MASIKDIKGEFSNVSGTDVRRYFNTKTGEFMGLITKLESGGYRVSKFPQNVVRVKPTLAEARRSLARSN